MVRFSSFRALAIVGLLLALHLPFLISDPDPMVSELSRGPWTDEGLNTIQIRNFVNHGYLSLSECDNLIKTPFFGFVLVPFYSLLGTDIWVGRAVVLGAVLLVLFLLLVYQPTRTFAVAFAFLGLLQFHLFHYTHYSMAEMMGVAFILLGIFMMRLAYEKEQLSWHILAASAFGLAFLSKVTFAYALFIPLIGRFFLFLSERTRRRDSIRSLVADGGISLSVISFFAASFYFKWFLRYKDVFDLVKANQGNNRFDLSTAWERTQFNWDNFIAIDGIAPFFVLLAITMLAIIRTSDRSRGDRAMLFGLLAWIMLEGHRFLLVNPPTRYLIPLFASVLALSAFGITQWKDSNTRRVIGVCVIVGFSFYNLSFYTESLARRTFVMDEIGSYLEATNMKESTVLGVWATGLAAKTEAHTLPVWNNFMNYNDPIFTYKPRVVISESNEAESSQAFISQDINLEAISDSIRHFDIWRYHVNIYWISPEACSISSNFAK